MVQERKGADRHRIHYLELREGSDRPCHTLDTWSSGIQEDFVAAHQVMQLLRVSRRRGLSCKRIAHGEQKRTLVDCFVHVMKNMALFRNPNGSSVGEIDTHFRSE